MPWWQVGLLIATFQFCRALANLFIPLFGKVIYHILGVSIGLAGYAFHSGMEEMNKGLFWAGAAMIGFSEVITCMQHYVKVEYVRFGVPIFRQRLRLQYACNVLGTAIGFLVAGFLLDTTLDSEGTVVRNVNNDGKWGIALQICELAATLAYLFLCKFFPQQSAPTADFALLFFSSKATTTNKNDPKERQNAEVMDPPEITISQLNGDLAEEMDHTVMLPEDDHQAVTTMSSLTAMGIDIVDQIQVAEIDRVYPTKMGIENKDDDVPWINYMLVATFAIQALCIGTILSTAPILLFVKYSFAVQWIGLLFGSGEILGSIFLFSFVPASTQMSVRKYFPGPLNVLIIVGTLGILANLLAIKNPSAAIAFIVLIMGFNDVGSALNAEAQGATVAPQHYARLNALSNISRRAGNTVTAALGPILFGVVYYLPFVCFGSLTIAWIIVMTVAFHNRGKHIAKILNENSNSQDDVINSGLSFYLRSRTFVTSEVEARKKMQSSIS